MSPKDLVRRIEDLEEEVERLRDSVHTLAGRFDEIREGGEEEDRGVFDRMWIKEKISGSSDGSGGEEEDESDDVPDYLR